MFVQHLFVSEAVLESDEENDCIDIIVGSLIPRYDLVFHHIMESVFKRQNASSVAIYL